MNQELGSSLVLEDSVQSRCEAGLKTSAQVFKIHSKVMTPGSFADIGSTALTPVLIWKSLLSARLLVEQIESLNWIATEDI
jgi:fumarate hydratase class II